MTRQSKVLTLPQTQMRDTWKGGSIVYFQLESTSCLLD